MTVEHDPHNSNSPIYIKDGRRIRTAAVSAAIAVASFAAGQLIATYDTPARPSLAVTEHPVATTGVSAKEATERSVAAGQRLRDRTLASFIMNSLYAHDAFGSQGSAPRASIDTYNAAFQLSTHPTVIDSYDTEITIHVGSELQGDDIGVYYVSMFGNRLQHHVKGSGKEQESMSVDPMSVDRLSIMCVSKNTSTSKILYLYDSNNTHNNSTIVTAARQSDGDYSPPKTFLSVMPTKTAEAYSLNNSAMDSIFRQNLEVAERLVSFTPMNYFVS